MTLPYRKKEERMVILIGGATHTGKTLLAQKLLERHHWPYLSLDHLKMGLIRSGNTDLTVFDDEKMTAYLWPIAREMVKTAIENQQDLILEGCYIPYSWQEDFEEAYLSQISCCFLVMTPDYIRSHFSDIRDYGSVIEARLDDSGLDMEELIRENAQVLENCRKYGCRYLLIEDSYDVTAEQVCF